MENMKRISYSRIKKYMSCPLQMKGAYELGIRGTQSPQSARGVEIHSIFEEAVKQQIALPSEFNFYDAYIKKLAGASCELEIATDRSWAPTAADDPDAWLYGIVDLWITQGNRGTLLDWKTGKEYPDHVMQKEFYVCMIADHFPEIEIFDTVNVYLDQKTIKSHRFTRVGDIEHLRERWGNRIKRMEADDICAPTPGPYCRWCDVSKKRGGPCQF